MEKRKIAMVNKNEERHVHINSNLDISKLKKHYEPLEIQVTFNNNDEEFPECVHENNIKGERHNDSLLQTKSKQSDIINNEDKVADEIAKLLAMIHIKDTYTIDLLRKHISFLMTEITKRNTIIFSLLKHLDFAVNKDIETIKNNEQLNEYLNQRKIPVGVNDVISHSHWNPDNVKSNYEKVSEYDWKLDIFQYIKANIDNIDTILTLPEKKTDINSSTNNPYNITKNKDKKKDNVIDNPMRTENYVGTSLKGTTLDPSVEGDEEGKGDNEDANNDDEWPESTIAIIGDNMLHGLDEKRLGGKNWNVKCRYFPDAQVHDFFHYVKPILKMKPSHLVVHVGTNDAPYFSSIEIYNSIISLKQYIEQELSTCKVIISRPIIRMDDCKANMAILKVNQYLDNIKIPTIDNGNFGLNHLSDNGPNLNPKGTARLAMNIISHLRSLQNELAPKITVTTKSSTPSTPSTPGTPDTPVTYGASGTSSTSGASKAPSAPSALSAPGIHGTPSIPGECLLSSSILNPSAKSFSPSASSETDI